MTQGQILQIAKGQTGRRAKREEDEKREGKERRGLKGIRWVHAIQFQRAVVGKCPTTGNAQRGRKAVQSI